MRNYLESATDYYNHIETPGTFHKFQPVSKTKIMDNKNSSRRSSANDLYDVYSVPQKLHDYENGYKFTEGVYDIATYEDCFWLLDLILDHQINLNFENQIWHFKRTHQESFTLTCKNKEGYKLAEIENLQTNFYFDDLTIIKKDKMFCLPIEESMYSL